MRDGRPTRVDALLGVAVFCLVAAAVATEPRPLGETALAYAFAAGFGALMLASHRWPVAVPAATAVGLVCYYLLDLPPIGLAAPIAAALYGAAERGRLRAGPQPRGGGRAGGRRHRAGRRRALAARPAGGDDPAGGGGGRGAAPGGRPPGRRRTHPHRPRAARHPRPHDVRDHPAGR